MLRGLTGPMSTALISSTFRNQMIDFYKILPVLDHTLSRTGSGIPICFPRALNTEITICAPCTGCLKLLKSLILKPPGTSGHSTPMHLYCNVNIIWATLITSGLREVLLQGFHFLTVRTSLIFNPNAFRAFLSCVYNSSNSFLSCSIMWSRLSMLEVVRLSIANLISKTQL